MTSREAEHLARVYAIQAAVLMALRRRPMTAAGIGRHVFCHESKRIADARAMGRLLSMRRDGLVEGKVDGVRSGAAKWKITDAGRAWLVDIMTIKGDP